MTAPARPAPIDAAAARTVQRCVSRLGFAVVRLGVSVIDTLLAELRRATPGMQQSAAGICALDYHEVPPGAASELVGPQWDELWATEPETFRLLDELPPIPFRRTRHPDVEVRVWHDLARFTVAGTGSMPDRPLGTLDSATLMQLRPLAAPDGRAAFRELVAAEPLLALQLLEGGFGDFSGTARLDRLHQCLEPADLTPLLEKGGGPVWERTVALLPRLGVAPADVAGPDSASPARRRGRSR